MTKWEEEFEKVIKKAIRKEERALCKLTEGRPGYDVLSWGVGGAYENILVFLIYKELLDAFPEYSIEWESRYPNSNKRADLYFKPKQAKWEYYVEAKWYYSKGLQSDYRKLLPLRRRATAKRYLLIFHRRIAKSNWPLKRKLDRINLIKKGKIIWANDNERSIDIKIMRYCDKDNFNQEFEGLLEIALLKIV